MFGGNLACGVAAQHIGSVVSSFMGLAVTDTKFATSGGILTPLAATATGQLGRLAIGRIEFPTTDKLENNIGSAPVFVNLDGSCIVDFNSGLTGKLSNGDAERMFRVAFW